MSAAAPSAHPPEPELLDALAVGTRLSIRIAHSCHRRLAWDCQFAEESAAAQLLQALPAAGYADESRCLWLRELRHRAGHGVIFVPRTGRVQIRLHYLTPAAERTSAALSLAAELAELLSAFN